MYRIKLTNGDVLQFDSLEALTGAIHAGAISEASLIFHQRSEQWLPISVHPHYKSAMATRPAAAPAAPVKPPVTVREMRPLRAVASKPLVATTAAAPRMAPTVVRTTESIAPATATASAPTATATAGLPVIDIDRLEESLELLDPTEMEASAAVLPAPAPAPVAVTAPVETEVAVDEPVAIATPVVEAPVVAPPAPESLVIPVGEMGIVSAASIDLAAGNHTAAATDDVLDESLVADEPTALPDEAELLDLNGRDVEEHDVAAVAVVPPARRSPLPWIAAAAVLVGAAGTVFIMRPARAAAPSAAAPVKAAAPTISAPLTPPPVAIRPVDSSTASSASAAEIGSLNAVSGATPEVPAAAVVDEKAALAATKANDRDKTTRDKARADSAKAIAERGQIVAAPTVGGLGTSADVRADISPTVLAARYTVAYDEAWNDLVNKLKVNGFDQVFAAARLSPSGAAATRATIVAARASVGSFRTRAGTIEKAYRDSAAALAANGAWDAQEQKEWENKPKRVESGESVTEANALLGTLERMYGVLAANTQSYSLTPAGLTFTDGGAQREYWELRRTLLAQLAGSADAPARSPELLVVRAIGAGRPPESVNAP